MCNRDNSSSRTFSKLAEVSKCRQISFASANRFWVMRRHAIVTYFTQTSHFQSLLEISQLKRIIRALTSFWKWSEKNYASNEISLINVHAWQVWKYWRKNQINLYNWLKYHVTKDKIPHMIHDFRTHVTSISQIQTTAPWNNEKQIDFTSK